MRIMSLRSFRCINVKAKEDWQMSDDIAKVFDRWLVIKVAWMILVSYRI
jgi:hypothetical protein